MRRLVAIGAVVLVVFGACGGSNKTPISTPQVTLSLDGPLSPALLSASQLRRVPGFSTAVVQPFAQANFAEDPDPRGPCGGKVPVLKLSDAVAMAWTAQPIRSGAQQVIRRPAGEVKKYLTARLNDIGTNCGVYTTKTAQGLTQEVKYAGSVRIARDADQSLVVISAIKIGAFLRAATAIEVRRGDVLSRAVFFSDQPLDNTIVRGIGNLMATGLQRLK